MSTVQLLPPSSSYQSVPSSSSSSSSLQRKDPSPSPASTFKAPLPPTSVSAPSSSASYASYAPLTVTGGPYSQTPAPAAPSPLISLPNSPHTPSYQQPSPPTPAGSSAPTQEYYAPYVDDYQKPQAVCENCGGNELEEDRRSGDTICSQCGTVQSERLISQEAEYRVFSEDSASYEKIRIGQSYNIFRDYSLTERSRIERDEKEFLWDGMRNIDDIFFRLFRGDSSNKPVLEKAKELFQKAFHKQMDQKKGAVPMKRSNKKSQEARQKFSKRKQFVVTCLLQSLQEHGIFTWTIKGECPHYGGPRLTRQDLNEQLDGIQVSETSVNNCLEDLGLPAAKKSSK